jgi:hypothetical protein
MPFNEALFWFGLTAFGTGLYFLFEATVKRVYSIGVTVIGVLACVYAEYRHYHPEIPGVPLWVILLLLTWALLGYSIYLRRSRPPSVEITGTGVEWRAGFSRPRFEIVDDHKFENEEIVVDNKSFRRCSFKNVKLLFHGHAPFEFVEGTTIDAGTVLFTTDDPAVMAFTTIQRKFASLPGAQIQHGALDRKGKDVPLSPLTVEPVAAFPKPSQYPIPSLRLRIMETVSQLQGFLGSHGEEPKVERRLPESPEAFQQRWRSEVMPWRAKFLGNYRMQFGDSIPRLRDEIRSRAGIDDFTLNLSIQKAESDPNGNVQAVEGIARRLWELGYEINT